MLDEPSLGLAPLIVREIFRIIADLRATGVSILLVEQNARAALQVADYGYVLETGEIVLEGPARELADEPARGRDLSRILGQDRGVTQNRIPICIRHMSSGVKFTFGSHAMRTKKRGQS